MKTHKQSGFTLIELMIVVTIIGILAAVAVPLYRDYTIRSRVVGDIASVWNPLKTSISLYYNNLGSFPATLNELQNETGVSNDPDDHSGRYVEKTTLAAGVATIIMDDATDIGIGPKHDASSPGAANATLIYTANVGTGSTIQWNITTTGTTLPEKYWPEKQR